MRARWMCLLSCLETPLGTLADHDLRVARVETHRMFESLSEPPACMPRHDAHARTVKLLAIRHEEAHIASPTYDEAIKVQLAMEDLLQPLGEKPDLSGAAHWLQRAGIYSLSMPTGCWR